MSIRAIVVTHNPPSEFFDNLGKWRDQLNQLVIIDNGSGPETRSLFQQVEQDNTTGAEFIFNETNLGMASALNQGFSWAIKRGSNLVFAFDQDSQPAPDMIGILLDTFHSHPNRGKIAIVAPMIWDPVTGRNLPNLRSHGHIFFERTNCAGNILENVSVVITSGALYNLSVYLQVGSFRDDFFIDYVDTEYCLRAQQYGYNIIVNCHARLYHRLGNQQTKRVGPFAMHPTFHSPLRWYYISRNRVPMYRSYALRFPHWFLYELVVNSYGLIRLLLFEDQKAKKLLAMLLGTLDGLNRRMGPISNSRRALIMKGD